MIPERTLQGIEQYYNNRIPPGGFLTAVLENNLMESCAQADETNRAALYEICCLLYNNYPSKMWGTPERVKNWLGKEEE